jgi:TonB family protein
MKASLVLIAAFLITSLLKRRAAAERHVVWTAALIAASALPLLTLLMPTWRPELAERMASALPSLPPTIRNLSAPGSAGTRFQVDGIESAVVSRLLPAAWVAGAAVGLLILGAGFLQQRRLASRSISLSNPTVESIAAELARQDGWRRRIRLTRSLDDVMPMTWGILRPQILLPSCVDQWSDARKRVVIAHELAHVKRFDYLFQSIAQIACAVYWFNPLFWMACRRLQRESESACDDAVVNLGVDPREYASHLLEIARAAVQWNRRWSPTLAMARRSTLEKRFAALLMSKANRTAATRTRVLFAAAVTLCLVLPLAAMRVSDAVKFVADEDSPSPKVEQYTNPPLYSDEGRDQRIEGIVTVEVRVAADGSVKGLQVLKGLGHGLDENALLAVRDWRFVPARRNGFAIESSTSIDVEFSLRNAELNEEIANDMATRIGPGVIPPQVVQRIEPELPADMAKVLPAGPVVLDAVILEGGIPKIVRVIQSQNWVLDEIAINALKLWRFSPAIKDGQAVRVRMNIAVNFNK